MTINRRPRSTSDDRELRLWRVGRALAVTFLVAVLAASGVFYGLIYLLDFQEIDSTAKLNAKTLFELVKLSFGVVAGAGALVALVVAYRRQRVDEAGAHREATRLHTERFSQAVDKLGSDSPAVRLGGVHALAGLADGVEREHGKTAEGLRVWGGLIMSAATSAARSGDYETAKEMMTTAEDATKRLAALPPPADGKMLSVFSRSSVRIERVRLAVQHAKPEEALLLAKGMRLSADIPPSWRTWLLLDVARAHTDLGNAEGA